LIIVAISHRLLRQGKEIDMSFVNITIVDPLPSGTPIYDVSKGTDDKHKHFVGLSNNWSTRWRLEKKGGCPSWIDEIVIGANAAVLKKTKVRPTQVPAVASSSMSSRDVLAIFLDGEGDEDHRVIYPFVYVPKSHSSERTDSITGMKRPVADELWFSSKAVDDPLVEKLEADCNHPLE
jgi:hypothetical protein